MSQNMFDNSFVSEHSMHFCFFEKKNKLVYTPPPPLADASAKNAIFFAPSATVLSQNICNEFQRKLRFKIFLIQTDGFQFISLLLLLAIA